MNDIKYGLLAKEKKNLNIIFGFICRILYFWKKLNIINWQVSTQTTILLEINY